ncbi:MAG: patatin-like phospholipase family protein [Trueperaceae bacterium]
MNVGLVLSGGGARCFSHLGGLKALEEHNIKVSAIAGSSSGAIIGALYASGLDAETIHTIVKTINYSNFWRTGVKGGLISHDGLSELVSVHAAKNFEDLKIPLAVTTVDIQSGELLVLQHGPLAIAACASNAFPGLFAPIKYLDRYLMDGGILNNFPVDIIRTLTTDPVVAFDATVSDKRNLDFEGEEEKPNVLQRVRTTVKGKGVPTPLLVDVLVKAYTITQTRLIELRSTMHPPDYVVKPALPDDLSIESFGRLEEAYELGYEATMKVIEKLPKTQVVEGEG